MYQCLMYALNNAAAESMFSDTSVYENINRLVHLIGYSPKGIIPSTAYFYLNNKEKNDKTGGEYSDKTILKYTAIDTGKIDQNGNTVYYSTKTDFKITDDVNYKFKMYNGRWKHYTPQIAAGIPYETFVLAGLKSSIEDKAFVANDGIDVYVEDPDTGYISQYDVTDQELFTNNDITDIVRNLSVDTSSKKSKKVHLDEVDLTQMSLFDTISDDDIIDELRNVDIGNLTPLDALNKLYELQNKVKNRW